MEQVGATCEVKVAVLEQRVIDLKEIVLKLEETIEKVNELNLNVIKMLAVHEERINTNEQNNQTVFTKVLDLETKNIKQKEEFDTKLAQLKIDYKNDYNQLLIKLAMVGGGFAVIVFIIANFSFFEHLFDKPDIKKTLLTNPPIHARLI